MDSYGRAITGIRVSLTQRCNLNCIYCHHEGEAVSSTEMSCDEISRIIHVAAGLGISRVKYTGGEPLLREDLDDIILETISAGISDVAITTNGLLLSRRAKGLKDAGLRRLNISLPSLKPGVYNSLTGGDLGAVIEGIRSARSLDLDVKLNTVIMQGINVSEIDVMMDFAHSNGCSLQIIELEDLGIDRSLFESLHFDLSGVEDEISIRAVQVSVREDMNRRTRYRLGSLQVEVVRPLNNPSFCSRCSRLRLTSSGKLKPCLMRSDNLIDLIGPMRMGCPDTMIKDLFLNAVGRRAPYYTI
jgi:cyclic pyranopterin phosphate synthase